MPAARERRAGPVVGLHRGEPGLQVAAAGAGGHHLGECGHVPGKGVDVRAAGPDGRKLGLLVCLRWSGRVSSQLVIWRVFGTAGAGPGAVRACRNGRT